MPDRLHAVHPERVHCAAREYLGARGLPERLRDEADRVLTAALPPATSWAISEAVSLFHRFGLVGGEEIDALVLFCTENLLPDSGRTQYNKTEYPFFAALERIGRLERPKVPVATLVERFADRWCTSPKYTVGTYYKDVLAVRGTLIYAYSTGLLDDAGPLDADALRCMLDELARRAGEFSAAVELTRRKIQIATQLLTGERECGESQRQGSTGPRSKRKRGIGMTLTGAAPQNTRETQDSEVTTEEDGVYATLRMRSSSVQKDWSYRTKDVLKGFARSNVPSDADMSGCSFVVYRGFLEFTGRQATKTEFALIWCSAIAGLDVNRSFVLARKGRSVPKNLEIVVANGVIRYHIVRRRIGSKNDEFESAGVMTLPVPRIVEEGLNELTLSSDGRQPSEIVNRLCTRFARDRAGQAPTAVRLRATSRVRFPPFGLRELDYAAVSGRVQPQLKAVSHYYPKRVREVADRFCATYAAAAREWGVLDIAPLPAKPRKPRDFLLAKRVATKQQVGTLLRLIAERYALKCDQLGASESVVSLIDTVVVQQVGAYVLQEFGVGLRPIGKVAGLTMQSRLGAMTSDKASRLFAERSYSPLSDRHAMVANAAAKNRALLSKALSISGIAERTEENTADLACHYRLVRRTVVRKRMTGRNARGYVLAKVLSTNLPTESNWMRKGFTDAVLDEIWAWMRDEIVGHRRVGREPFAKYSTAGMMRFQEAQEFLESLHADVVPVSLSMPVSGVERPWYLPTW